MGCVEAGCGREPGSWRAFRCQLPPGSAAGAPAQAAAPALAAAGTLHAHAATDGWAAEGDWGEQAASPPAGLASSREPGTAEPDAAASGGYGAAWHCGSHGPGQQPGRAAGAPAGAPAEPEACSGADDTAWGAGGDWEAGGPAGGADAFDLGDLDAALAALAEAPRGAAPPPGPKRRSAGGAGAAPSCRAPGRPPTLPGFYLHAAGEPAAAAAAALTAREADHVAALLAEYEASGAPVPVRRPAAALGGCSMGREAVLASCWSWPLRRTSGSAQQGGATQLCNAGWRAVAPLAMSACTGPRCCPARCTGAQRSRAAAGLLRSALGRRAGRQGGRRRPSAQRVPS
jgi:hypothetical protein